MSQPIEKVESHRIYVRGIQLSLLKAVTLVFVVAPILGEFGVYHFTGRINNSITSSLCLILATILNYLCFLKSKNLKRALRFTPLVQFACFSWGLLVSGGIHAERMVYMPFFPVIIAFVYGRRGALWSTLLHNSVHDHTRSPRTFRGDGQGSGS